MGMGQHLGTERFTREHEENGRPTGDPPELWVQRAVWGCLGATARPSMTDRSEPAEPLFVEEPARWHEWPG